jgi:hypothetical protein
MGRLVVSVNRPMKLPATNIIASRTAATRLMCVRHRQAVSLLLLLLVAL